MKNFKSFSKNYNEFRYTKYYEDGRETVELNHSHKTALLCGFSVDVGLDVYTYEDLGAFVINVGENIKTIEDLQNQYDEVLKCNPYHKILEMMNQGYKFSLGPAFPTKSGYVLKNCLGLYCSNYREKIQEETQLEI